MTPQTSLVERDFLLEKFEGKGGWTFVRIPEITQNKNNPFGWVRVRGKIDNFEINNYNLQSMGNGTLFLPVKVEIRKKIKKSEGDTVHIILFADNLPTEITDELRLCLMDEPNAYEVFISFTLDKQKNMIEWIYSAKTEEIKVDRIVNVINKIIAGDY